MNVPQFLAEAKKVPVPQKLMDQYADLWGRWQDEKEYEDFDDYKKFMGAMVEEAGGKLLTMTQRPWRLEFKIQGYRKYIVKKGNYMNFGTMIPPEVMKVGNG